MAAKPITLQVQPRGKPIRSLPKETSIYIQGSTNDLYHRVAAESNFSVHRLRITTQDGTLVPNEKTVSVESTGLKNGGVIKVKDLGPQIDWRTVFVIEYIGPILIHPLVFYLRPFIYEPIYGARSTTQPSQLQYLTLWMVLLHFLKREFETLFVHRFSKATMPAFNIFKNSGHYWVLSGLLIALAVYSPNALAAAESIPALTYTGIALFTVGELMNLYTHLVLRGLRSAGGTERGVPKGFSFNWVTCPNYFWEAVAWTGILLVSRSWATAVFIIVAVGQMIVWAQGKERRYRKELGTKYPKKRYSMFPGII